MDSPIRADKDGVRIAACLIVKDAEATLRRCLQSLAGVVDEIVVYDTGSSDSTVAVAQECGAVVVRGYWDDDFARARNAALTSVTAEWVLSIDADEWVEAELDRMPALRACLAAGPPLWAVERQDISLTGSTRFAVVRLFRRAGAQWTGRVHERVENRDVSGVESGRCDPRELRLHHDGYLDPDVARAKALRNAAVSEAEIAALGEGPRLARAWLDLGRSQAAAQLVGPAIEAFEQVREMAPGTDEALRATDHLARMYLVAGQLDRVERLVAQLRQGGTDERYCRWLRAQACALSGQGAHALELLVGVDELIDPAGHHHDIGQVVEFRALTRAMTGDLDGALRDLLVAMVAHGRVAGRATLVREWWGARPLDEVLTAVHACGGPFAVDTERELRIEADASLA